MSGGKRSHLRKQQAVRELQARVAIHQGVNALMGAPFGARMRFVFLLASRNRVSGKAAILAGFALGCAGFGYAVVDLLQGVGL